VASYVEVGDTETLTLDVAVAGVPTDPTSLQLTIAAPDGTATVEVLGTAPAIAHPAVGRFERDLTYTAAGTWAYRWTAAGPTQVQGERVHVRASTLDALPRSLSLEELKRRVDHRMDVDEDLLADDLAAAFLQAQRPAPYGCGRVLAPDPARDSDPEVTRALTGTRRRLRLPDARSVSVVTVDGEAATGYRTLEHRGLLVQLELVDDGRWSGRWVGGGQEGASFVRRDVAVTGRFGFAQVPEDLAGAIYALAARWHYERQAQYADQVAILEGSAVQSYFRQVPPRVQLVFKSYEVPPAVGGLR
jgi:hypothetical protein